MKSGGKPEICSGTYYPRKGVPQRGYYVLIDAIVMAGPFRSRRGAEAHLAGMMPHQPASALAAQTSHPASAPQSSMSITQRVQKKDV